MVTTGGRQNRKKKASIHNLHLRLSKPEWVLTIGLAAVVVYGIVNVTYSGYNTDYKQVDNSVLFADVKSTPLVTNITKVVKDGNLRLVNFAVENENATLKLGTFECSIDDADWKKCISPVVVDFAKNELLAIRAVDNQGGIESQPAVYIVNLTIN